MKRKRKNNLHPVDRYLLDAVVQVYSSSGLDAEFSITGKSKDGDYHVVASQKHGVSTIALLQLFAVLRNVLQERLSADIHRAGDWVAKETAPMPGQLELPGTDDVTEGFIDDDAVPF